MKKASAVDDIERKIGYSVPLIVPPDGRHQHTQRAHARLRRARPSIRRRGSLIMHDGKKGRKMFLTKASRGSHRVPASPSSQQRLAFRAISHRTGGRFLQFVSRRVAETPK